MPRLINQSPVEIFVRQYIRQNKFRKTTLELNFYKKALLYVQMKLEGDCCDSNNPIVNLYTRFDNELTLTVYRLLVLLPRNGHRLSLERTANLLAGVITDICCAPSPDSEEIVSDQDIVNGQFVTVDTLASCDSLVTYSGVSSFPRIIKVTLGAGTGTVNFTYNAFNIPDKFIVWYDDVATINTGYRGNSSYQAALTAELASRSLSNETIAGVGVGSASFVKSTTTTVAYVFVYAPLDNTQWNFTLECVS